MNIISDKYGIRNPRFFSISFGLLIVFSIGAFVAGYSLPNPNRDAIALAQQNIDVFSPVEKRSVDTRQSFAGNIRLGEISDLTPMSLPSPAVITRSIKSAGSIAQGGDLLAVISGVPIFGLSAPLAMYRDLAIGDEGDDVLLLQQSLNRAGLSITETGLMNWETLRAVNSLYQNNGFDPTGQYFSISNFVVLPSQEVAVISSASVGSQVNEKTPFAQVRSNSTFVVFRADASVSSTITVGEQMTVKAAQNDLPVEVSNVGVFNNGTEGQIPGRDVYLRFISDGFGELADNTAVTVYGPGSQISGDSVPISAIKSDSKGTFVLKEDSTNASKVSLKRASVEILATGDGWAVITSNELTVGDKVQVSK